MMSPEQARHVLGLAELYGPDDLRAAYRAAARRLHPDRPGAAADATERMVAVNLAYDVLAVTGAGGPAGLTAPGRPAGAPTRPTPHAAAAGPAVEVYDDGSLLVEAPAEETYDCLLEAIESVGDPTYVDPDSGLLQIIVSSEGEGPCYLTFSLQGRASGTEVFSTIERLDGMAAPDPGPILALLAERIRQG